MNFIREKVKENKEILKQLWVAAFIGNLARKYDLTVTVRTQSCVFILGLFNLLPYEDNEYKLSLFKSFFDGI